MAEVEQFIKDMGDKIHAKIEKKRRFYFNVSNDNLPEVADYLFHKMGCRLSTATAMEMYHGIEILYHFSNDKTGQYFCPRVVIKDKKNPKVNSITSIITGAIWIEREMFDLWGIEFIGHPRMEELLTLNNPGNVKQPLRFKEGA
ncbi:MAG TPA: NADH-quinone oxidoreductase subunit C [Candidatus Marinimicrobia bacterium]|nr:NADH-quinone oxidoreductase subunit C [Candidatus Neomarinimicrobiota bacterium]